MRLGYFLVILSSVLGMVLAASDRLQVGILERAPECSVKARPGDIVRVHYVGKIADGKEFDNSYKRGAPFPFTLGTRAVIEGWEKGVLGMCLGEKRRLTIPPHMGYGDRGAGPIPGGSTLVFDVYLVGLNDDVVNDGTKDEL